MSKQESRKVNFVYYLLITIHYLLITGCSDQNPSDRLINPIPKGATNTTQWSTKPWVIYDDELKTGGGMMYYSSSDGQKLDFASTENPRSGTKCIKYSWNGSSVYDYGRQIWQKDWCGWGIISGKDWTSYDTSSRDLSESGYTKIVFWVRGNIDSNTTIKFEGPVREDKGGTDFIRLTSAGLTSSWQQKEISLSGTDLSDVKDFFKVIFEKGAGGTVYIDDIQYTR